jgi:hypothetical protein
MLVDKYIIIYYITKNHECMGDVMGKNISVYLNDDLLGMVEASGLPASKIVQEALKKYFHPENRAAASKKVIEASRSIGKSKRLSEAISDWRRDREFDRW